MKKLIVTADDYGMSSAVNAAIDAGIAAGLITSTNVMTNMPCYAEAAKLRDLPVSVGIHWTLSCGKPTLPAEEIPTLVTVVGEFYSYPEFRKRYRKKQISEEDIRKELAEQYKRFTEVCGEADYWNTHQNVHVDFGIYRLFADMAASLGIPRMRSHQRIYVPESVMADRQPLLWRLIEPIKSRLLNIWQRNAHKRGLRSPDGLIVCLNNKDTERLEHVFANIQWKKNEIGEFVIHPATECDSPYFGKIVDRRIREYELFTSDKTRKLIEKNNLTLVTYESV